MIQRYAFFAFLALLLVSTFFVPSPPVYAQNADTLAEVRLANILVIPPRTVEFDIVLKNSASQHWYWANGTFFVNVQGMNLQNAVLEQDSSGLLAFYQFKASIDEARSRIAVAFLGADSVESSTRLDADATVLVGRFRLIAAQNLVSSFSLRLAWLTPLARFQANALKCEQMRLEDGIEYKRNDNLEMRTQFAADSSTLEPAPVLVSGNFSAEYIGDKRVRLAWQTANERLGRRVEAGFVLLRTTDGVDSSRTDTVASFFRSSLLRLSGKPHGYTVVDSLGLERGRVYRYRLQCVNVSPASAQPFERIDIVPDTASARVANAVVIEGTASPNPFTTQTLIRYRLDDRAQVTAVLYDATGRVITRLLDEIELPRGEHIFALDGTAITPQSALLLVLTARPVDDAAVERSQVVLKLQRVR
jgi:hypothetical protein